MKELRLLSPCGILGYGFPKSSFLGGVAMNPDAIVVDTDSTDAGPYKLGMEVAIVSRRACKKDLEVMITNGIKAKIPTAIGSTGGAGGRVHAEWTLPIIEETLEEHGFQHLKLTVIWADIERRVVKQYLSKEKADPLNLTVSGFTPEYVKKTTGIVAQMGHKLTVRTLEQGADIIVCGYTYGPSSSVAVVVFHGFDMVYGYHVGRILECTALRTQLDTTKGYMPNIIREDGLVVTPLSKDRVCTKTSIVAHTFYEKDHPYFLHGPGIMSDLEHYTFIEFENGRSVFVIDSRVGRTDPCHIKLEGAIPVVFRTFVVTGICDPLLVDQLEEVQDKIKAQMHDYYNDADEKDHKINSINYDINGVMGEMEPCRDPPHEMDTVFEVIAKTQELADAVCSSVRSMFLHYEYEGCRSATGSLAFPFVPSDMPFGRVYESSLYCLVDTRDGGEMFPVEGWKGGGT